MLACHGSNRQSQSLYSASYEVEVSEGRQHLVGQGHKIGEQHLAHGGTMAELEAFHCRVPDVAALIQARGLRSFNTDRGSLSLTTAPLDG
jgi:hypothetical protein